MKVPGGDTNKYYIAILLSLLNLRESSNNDHAPHPGQEYEASHLCGEEECVVRNHLLFEDSNYNKSRWCCKVFGMPNSQFYNPDYRCPHNPLCHFLNDKGYPIPQPSIQLNPDNEKLFKSYRKKFFK